MKPSNLNGFYNPKTAREKSPVVSRPDLVAERNAAIASYSVADPARVPYIKNVADIRDREKTDTRVKCFRPNGTCYAVVSPLRWEELRAKKRLDSFLEHERDSGVILETERRLNKHELLEYFDRALAMQ